MNEEIMETMEETNPSELDDIFEEAEPAEEETNPEPENPQQEEPEQEEMILSSGLLLTREAESIEEALRRTGGNMRAAAALLGVSRGGLYLKTKRLGIDAGRWRK